MQNGPNNPNQPSQGFPNAHPQRVDIPAGDVPDEVKKGFIDEEVVKENEHTEQKEEAIEVDFEPFDLDKIDDSLI
ncbi:hypothetical protein VXN63_00480 [Marinilactibacillus sp. XAAS-LB27]|uniref:hypothetical protein n=1 Tax=Marinilactibacillus sp. XAAS-LB27 TaxID=3114538 RepID=UPI002E19DCE5|nr:hypothetical protein [Marinilactibacillus sp. XAAS-LB27]